MTESINLANFIRCTAALLQEQAAAPPEDTVQYLMSGGDIPEHRTLYVFMISDAIPLKPTPARRLMAAVIPVIATEDAFAAARQRLQTAFDAARVPGDSRLIAIDPEGNHEWLIDFIGVASNSDLPLALVLPMLSLPFGFAE